MQNRTAIQQVPNYDHTLCNLTTHPQNVCVLSCSISTSRSKASNRVAIKIYQLPDLHSGVNPQTTQPYLRYSTLINISAHISLLMVLS